MSRLGVLAVALTLWAFPAFGQDTPSSAPATSMVALTGNYQVAPGHILGIDLFDGGLLFSDYKSGVIRRLAASPGCFQAGPSFGTATPVEFVVRFESGTDAVPIALTIETAGKPPMKAMRLPLTATEVTFTSGDATLAGTLLVPGNSTAPRAAIVLLHGSGRQPRHSFGPYPHFFTSLGLAVLIFDKCATGASTGRFFDRTTQYPDVFTDDALGALRFLRARPEVDSRRVGLWGASEGGMLTTQVAARTSDVAFIISSSGFMVPLWQQVMFNIETQLKADGFSREDVAEAVRFESLAMRVMRTGQGWDEYSAAQTKALNSKWFPAYFGPTSRGFASLESLRRQWDYVYSFDPLPALAAVRCPVLAVFGELDTSTPSNRSADNMRRGLRAAGNRRVTIKIFDDANHPLMEAVTGGNAEIPTLKRMAPDVFDTLRTWIGSTVIAP